MALNAAALAKNFATLGIYESGNVAAAAFSNAYGLYAKQATDQAGNPLLTSQPAAFYAALAKGFSTSQGSASLCASAFCAAFSGFWVGATFTPGLPALGACVGGNGIMQTSLTAGVTAISTVALKSALTTLFFLEDQTASTNLIQLAQLLHTATTSAVIVTVGGIDTTPSPAGPLPTTQTGTLK